VSLINRQPIAELPVPAERVRLRERFGASQVDIAAELRVTRKTVYSWEHGLSEPTGRNRLRYSELLDSWARTERLAADAGVTGGPL
jgi:DNA-binding XRE family transcriptional regulator